MTQVQMTKLFGFEALGFYLILEIRILDLKNSLEILIMHKQKDILAVNTLRVLGIDPGTAIVGWAILDETKGCVTSVAYGHITTSPKNSTAERLFEVVKDLEQIIEKYKPDEAAVEDLFFFKNVKTVMKVSQARGSILLTLERFCVSIFEYTPLQVKQALTGYGRAEKKQIQLMVKNILKLKEVPKPDDTADAIAIALCHINSRKMTAVKKNC